MDFIEDGQFDDAEELAETGPSITDHQPIKTFEANLERKVTELKLDVGDGPSTGNTGDDGYWEEEDEEEDEDDSYDWDGMTGNFTKKYNSVTAHNQQPNSNRQPNKNPGKGAKHFQPTDKTMRKYVDKINVEQYSGPTLTSSAMSGLMNTGKKMNNDRYQRKDKADRATAEQVMDPRTRMILFKMLSKGIITEINGCISTGKEANVYHATAKDGSDRAVKVYKTSILVFKDRDKYVTGEFRFRHGYCKHNPRKMVKTWAEKEMRNLIRIHQSGILCPEPVFLRSHVLVMDFIGTDGWPAPLLKDCDLSDSKARELYLQCIHMVRTLYHTCKLIHADLSEFNMLYHEGRVYVIDVSQSVEHDHPHALEFLRKDCTNITDFFRKKGVCTLTMKELFNFVTDVTITDDNIDAYLDHVMEMSVNRTQDDITEQQKIDDEVFKNAFIPRTLDEVIDFERDFSKAQTGKTDHILYQTVTGLKADLTGAQQKPVLLESKTDLSEAHTDLTEPDKSVVDSDEEESDSDNESDDSNKAALSLRPRDESPNSKKERKQKVKEEQREKRKNKIPKHVKKKKEKMGKSGKKS
ncbi:serine/threonine-protein kinase RIO1-like [Mizuhopecten yessoensis]|uniref:serine/threonine-protein kinase RIO1-like n=1 Tax=Mizuhopecten yessoensis TaxID=6573 RepID=UPI000B458DB1|nr:serine/threonine-protein kinase RIO1-like [Mizuhopecten yessoensis]